MRQRAARTGINPKTLEKLQIPAKRTVAFTVSPVLKAALNGGAAYPFPGANKPKKTAPAKKTAAAAKN